MAAARHTNYNRPRRERTTEPKSAPETETQEKPVTGEEPKRRVYTKTTKIPIRIRKGPGLHFEHNGKYLDGEKKVEVCEIENGWGLLQSYAETRDGWVCLEFLNGPSE